MHEVKRAVFWGQCEDILNGDSRHDCLFEQFELLPINDVIQIAEPPFQHKISVATEEKVEKCFDDLRTAEAQVGKYLDNGYDDADDVLTFYEEITEVLEKFREAISSMGSSSGKDTIDACIKTYYKALGGRSFPGKFCLKWRNILKTKVGAVTTSVLIKPIVNRLRTEYPDSFEFWNIRNFKIHSSMNVKTSR